MGVHTSEYIVKRETTDVLIHLCKCYSETYNKIIMKFKLNTTTGMVKRSRVTNTKWGHVASNSIVVLITQKYL